MQLLFLRAAGTALTKSWNYEDYGKLQWVGFPFGKYFPCTSHGCFKCIVHLHFSLGMPEFLTSMLAQPHPPSLYLHTKAPPLISPRLNFLIPLQNSGIINLPSSKESWLGNISENPHGYCKHSIMPKGNPSNGNFHSWHPSLTSLCFLLPWLTSNDLMCRRWDYWRLP